MRVQELDATPNVVERYYSRNCFKTRHAIQRFLIILTFWQKQILVANNNKLLLICVLVFAKL